MIGKLVRKCLGYGANAAFPLIGVVVHQAAESKEGDCWGPKILVYTEGQLETWRTGNVEVINETR